jgi:hypothetical protein
VLTKNTLPNTFWAACKYHLETSSFKVKFGHLAYLGKGVSKPLQAQTVLWLFKRLTKQHLKAPTCPVKEVKKMTCKLTRCR